MDYDAGKNALNIADHGVGFDGCEAIFDGPTVDGEDRTVDYDGEERHNVIGFVGGVVMHLTYTDRDGELRPISYRKAKSYEIDKLRRYLRTPRR